MLVPMFFPLVVSSVCQMSFMHVPHYVVYNGHNNRFPNGRWLKTSKKILAGAIGIQNENWVGRKLNFDLEKMLIIVMYFEIFIINVVKLSMKNDR